MLGYKIEAIIDLGKVEFICNKLNKERTLKKIKMYDRNYKSLIIKEAMIERMDKFIDEYGDSIYITKVDGKLYEVLSNGLIMNEYKVI